MDVKTKKLAVAGVLCALVMGLTMVSLPLPSGYGYVNLGDAGVFLCALLLPGYLGVLAAGVGAAAADLLLGWAIYAPATVLIKGLCSLLVMLCQKCKKPFNILFSLVCTLTVPVLYFLYEYLLLMGPAAAANLLLNALQALIGGSIGLLTGALLKKRVPFFRD